MLREATMHISIMKTGGYAGLSEEIVNLDTSLLEPGAARAVEQAIENSGFYKLSGGPIDIGVGADPFKYEITITDGDQRHSLTFSDYGQPVTAALMDLIGKLTAIARSQ